MNRMKTNRISVPGASIYYEMHGRGPVLLMIPAGAGDADSYNSLLPFLGDQYTVVTYDRRGYPRSPLEHPDQIIEIGTHSDDIHYLLAALSSEPAYVFGCSIGALVGLDLAGHHPEQVRVVVAHEPPVGELLPPAERVNEDLPRLYQQKGSAEAMQMFMKTIGVTHNQFAPNIEYTQEKIQMAENNREAFFKHDAGAVARYSLDIATLKSIPTRVVIAGGSAGRDYFPYRCAVALADLLETQVIDFPGNHAGFMEFPKEFAARLLKLISDQM